jgi:hypothetical protein
VSRDVLRGRVRLIRTWEEEGMRGLDISGVTLEDEALVRSSAEYLGSLLPGLLDAL